LPDWCGSDKARNGHYAGHPGKAYAKILANKWNNDYPTAAYESLLTKRILMVAIKPVFFSLTGYNAIYETA